LKNTEELGLVWIAPKRAQLARRGWALGLLCPHACDNFYSGCIPGTMSTAWPKSIADVCGDLGNIKSLPGMAQLKPTAPRNALPQSGKVWVKITAENRFSQECNQSSSKRGSSFVAEACCPTGPCGSREGSLRQNPERLWQTRRSTAAAKPLAGPR